MLREPHSGCWFADIWCAKLTHSMISRVVSDSTYFVCCDFAGADIIQVIKFSTHLYSVRSDSMRVLPDHSQSHMSSVSSFKDLRFRTPWKSSSQRPIYLECTPRLLTYISQTLFVAVLLMSSNLTRGQCTSTIRPPWSYQLTLSFIRTSVLGETYYLINVCVATALVLGSPSPTL